MKTFLFIAISLLALPLVSFAQEAATTASHIKAAARLLDNMNMQETLDKTIDATLEVQMNQMPQMRNVEGVMRDFFTKYMSYDALKEDLTKLYARHYTEKELKKLGAFYRSRLGKKVSATTPTLTAESMLMGQELVKEHMNELQEAIMAKMAEENN